MTVTDIEIQMHMFRLMRDGHITKAAELIKAVQEDFPGIDLARIKACAYELARRLMS